MAPRGYDRYMVKIGMGTHPKFARLTDSEFRAHVVGVLAVAAMAPERGCLMVGNTPAEAIDVAVAAGVTEKVAASAMVKLEAVGVLRRDAERGCLCVHDWSDLNPPPGSSTERMRRHRASHRDSNGDANGNGARHASVTDASHSPSPEVEVEVEVPPTEVETPMSTLRADVIECFAYWQEKCRHPNSKLTHDRNRKIAARLKEGYTVAQIRRGIEGAARAAFVSPDSGKRFDDIELICRNGSKLESFIDRAEPARPPGQVVQMRPASLRQMDRWQDAPEYRRGA